MLHLKSFKLVEALKKHRLKLTRRLSMNRAICVDKKKRLLILKNGCENECKLANIINQVAQKYNHLFSVLILPEFQIIDYDLNIVGLPYYGEQNYNEMWESGGKEGGANLGLNLSSEMVMVIKDFLLVEVDEIIRKLNEDKVGNYRFNLKKWFKLFEQNSLFFINKRLISKDEHRGFQRLLKSDPLPSKEIFNNGDFYPRNLIGYKNRIIVIDWHTRSPSQRNNIIEPIENVVAFVYIHMWENQPWQINFLKTFRQYFNLQFSSIRKAILRKAFDQAVFWINRPILCKKQIEICKNILNEKFVKKLEKQTRNY